jgi:hypothetical protein
MFTVDQAYRINRNRSLSLQPLAEPTGAARLRDEYDGELLEMHCECSAEHCTATVVVPRGDYERLQPKQRQLLVAAGHELDSPVQVTLRTETYEIVEPWRPQY